MNESRPPVALGLDPGTLFGWAAARLDGTLVACGSWRLSGPPQEPRGMRWRRLRGHLRDALERWHPVAIVGYEEVPFGAHRGVRDSRSYGGMVAIIESVMAEAGIVPVLVNVTTAKVTLTGYGSADKEQMLRAARMQWPGVDVPDDNAADAAAICLAAIGIERRNQWT